MVEKKLEVGEWIPVEYYSVRSVELTLARAKDKSGKLKEVGIRIGSPTSLLKKYFATKGQPVPKDVKVKLFISADGKKIKLVPAKDGVSPRALRIPMSVARNMPVFEELKKKGSISASVSITDDGIVLKL